MHVDSKRYAALLEGTLPPDEARALSAHLAGECERCEAFLVGLGGADGIDGLADAAIAGSLPPASGEGNDLEFERIARALRRRPSARRRVVPAAVAASLLLAGLTALVVHGVSAPPAELAVQEGVKGFAARAIPVRLRFLEMAENGHMEKRISGEQVEATSSLLFEVEASRAAHVAIARVSPGGSAELIWLRRVEGGRTQVAVDGGPAAYPLSALRGPQRFVLVASEAQLDEPRLLNAARALAPPGAIRGDAPALDGLSLDVADLLVR